MNAGMIWWGQIGNSLHLISEVAEHLQECRSAVLRLPERLPWRAAFYEEVDIRRSAFGGRSLKRLSWSAGGDPGEFILAKLCSASVRADYWPGQSVADYLGSRQSLPLNDYYVWITGVRAKADLAKWAEFIARYDRASARSDGRAVFLVEYAGPALETGPVEQIVCTLEDYDCRVFCLEASAALRNAPLRDYQAELALRVGGTDPEFSWALLRTGEALLRDPVATAREVMDRSRESGGRPFGPMTEQQIVSAAWRAALVLFFPVLEQWRMDFVARYEQELHRHLPISNSNGEQVTDPFDLEIGALYYIVGLPGNPFTAGEVETIRLCRRTRNLLAHNKMISLEDARRIAQL